MNTNSYDTPQNFLFLNQLFDDDDEHTDENDESDEDENIDEDEYDNALMIITVRMLVATLRVRFVSEQTGNRG